MTIAQRYNAKVHELMPHQADRLTVDPSITCPGQIDDIVFRRSEYMGGMAAVILTLIQQN